MPVIVANLSPVERLPQRRVTSKEGNLEAYKPQAAADCKLKWQSCFANERGST
jgi:hypothetical protein